MPLEIKVLSPCFCFFTQRLTLYNSQWSKSNAKRLVWDHFEEQNYSTNAKSCPDCAYGALRRGVGVMLVWAMREQFLKTSSKGKCRSSSPNSSPITLRWEPLNQVPPETNWKLVEHNIDDSQTPKCESGSMRTADDMCGTNRTPHCKESPLPINMDAEGKNMYKGEWESIPLRSMECSLSWRPMKTRKKQRKAIGKMGGSRPL